MRKVLTIAATALAIVMVAALVGSAAQRHGSHARRTVHVIEHATTDLVIDTGKKDDTSGDLLTWHNKIYDKWDRHQVGHDQGDCIRISPRGGTWECRWITWVPGGAITVEGPFYDTHDSVLAITGGTGDFANARGIMLLKSRNGGTEYDFIFNLLG
jgi:allene oxide cyclase